jgi:hypothetical protein
MNIHDFFEDTSRDPLGNVDVEQVKRMMDQLFEHDMDSSTEEEKGKLVSATRPQPKQSLSTSGPITKVAVPTTLVQQTITVTEYTDTNDVEISTNA